MVIEVFVSGTEKDVLEVIKKRKIAKLGQVVVGTKSQQTKLANSLLSLMKKGFVIKKISGIQK